MNCSAGLANASSWSLGKRGLAIGFGLTGLAISGFPWWAVLAAGSLCIVEMALFILAGEAPAEPSRALREARGDGESRAATEPRPQTSPTRRPGATRALASDLHAANERLLEAESAPDLHVALQALIQDGRITPLDAMVLELAVLGYTFKEISEVLETSADHIHASQDRARDELASTGLWAHNTMP